MDLHSIPFKASFDLEPLRKFVEREILPGVKERDQSGVFPIEIFQKLHQFGYLQAAVPKEWGGPGASTTDLLWIVRELGYGSAGIAASFTANQLGMTAMSRFARPSLQKRLCENALETFSLWSFCMTEPDAGTDVAQISTTAVRVDGGYRISGKKCFITNASFADHLCVFAKINNGDLKPKISAFYVPSQSKGVSRGQVLKKLGQRESNTSEIYFDDVFIPNENLLSEEGDGLNILRYCISRSKTLLTGACVGLSQRAGTLAAEYLENRTHYGTSLLKLPTIHSQLAQLYTELEASWLLACLAAVKWDLGDPAVKEASMAKLFGTDMAQRFVTEAVELFGGYGYTEEFEIHRLYRDVRLFEILEGATFVQQSLIAREIFPAIRESKNSNLKKAA